MNRILLPLLLGTVLLSAGCAANMSTTADASREWRLQTLEESFLDFQEEQRRAAEEERRADREIMNRLDRLEHRVSEILGPGEELPAESPVERPAEGMAQNPFEPGATADSQQAMSSPAGMAPGAPQVSEPEMAEPLPAPVQAGPESGEEKPWAQVPGPALEAHARKPQPKTSTPPSHSSQYNKGLNLVRSGRLQQGRQVLESFLKEHPGHSLVPNAMYWIGESWYGNKQYPQAILAFKDVVTKYPQHHKAQAALLKIGMSYRNVGDKDNALFYLRTLVEDHPGSSPAKMAERLLREIPE
ncbi:tol-pal system protein YbgF [Paucidesulfovibrio gracilis DSM 16080]|uniref:Tol-pal system protein YbgF n=1 Tax=Paucidesulfovibrio gracilis DSM 16080 TaxID=1121449 RepID=A0A1T4XYM8_9BACT|nr:tol-pal system protein YbgF [Paucidesulfovibrio gracilis]SKA94141.1 tol-pal system protein YbgF [Paucidesulfovibrio gracilis DSM 16080]